MKKLLLILILTTILFGQGWNGYNTWDTWLTKSMPTPVADWKWNYGVTTVDTGTTVVNSLVSNWTTTKGLYDAQQTAVTARPIYDTTNGAIIFDGLDDFLNAGNILNPGIGGNFTVVSWINTSGNTYIVGKILNTGNYDGWAFRYDASVKKLKIWTSDGTAIGAWHYSNVISIEDANWHHVAVTFNSGNIIFYLDGVEVGTATGAAYANNTSSNLYIQRTEGGLYGTGKIAEITYFDNALSTSQVKQLYNKGKP